MTAFMENKRVLSGILVFLLILQALVSFQVLNRAEVVRIWDEAHYLERGLHFYYLIYSNQDGTGSLGSIIEMAQIQKCAMDRPPFIFVLQAFFWRALRVFNIWDENAVILILNTLYLFILALSCYGIGSFLCDRKTGFMSAILVSFFPLIYESSRAMMTDLPLTAMLCLSIYLLFKTRAFQSKFFSICLGIILAISQLTRETFVGYMVFPFLYYLYQSLRRGPKDEVIKNVLLCLGLGILIAAPVFLNPNSSYAYVKYWQLLQLKAPSADGLSFVNNLDIFLKMPGVIGYALFVSTFPLFISSIISVKKTDKILYLWFLIPILIQIVSPNKVIRFVMPVLPAYALIVSDALFKSKLNLLFKKYYFIIIMFLCLFQYIAVHYMPIVDNYSPKISDFGIKNMFARNEYFFVHKHLMTIFRNEQAENENVEKSRALVLFGVKDIPYPLYYKFRMENIPIFIDTSMEADFVDSFAPGTVDWEQKLLDSDYLIDKVGGFIGKRGIREDIRGQYEKALLKYREYFEIIAEIEVPEDNSRVLVYKKKPADNR